MTVSDYNTSTGHIRLHWNELEPASTWIYPCVQNGMKEHKILCAVRRSCGAYMMHYEHDKKK